MARNQTKPKLTILSADKDAKQLKLSYIVGGNAKQYGYFGKVCDIFINARYTYRIDLTIPILGFYPKNLRLHKNLYMNVYSSLKTTQTGCNSNVLQLVNGETNCSIYISHDTTPQRYRSLHTRAWMNLMCITPSERSQTQKAKLI